MWLSELLNRYVFPLPINENRTVLTSAKNVKRYCKRFKIGINGYCSFYMDNNTDNCHDRCYQKNKKAAKAAKFRRDKP